MSNSHCPILPDLIAKYRQENSDQYLARLYSIFEQDFKVNPPLFLGKPVEFRVNPITHGYEEAFFHMTHVDYDKRGFENRDIDYVRSECIAWIKAIISNYPCSTVNCSSIKAWKKKHRIHLLCEPERYLIVLEERKLSYQLVTAYRLNRGTFEIEKKIREYEYYKNIPI